MLDDLPREEPRTGLSSCAELPDVESENQRPRPAPTRRRVLAAGLGVVLATGMNKPFAQSARTPIKVVNSAGNINSTFEVLLERLHYMDELGLQARTATIADGSKVMASLISGDEDICMFAGIGQVFPAIEKGARLKIVAGATMTPDQAVFTSNPSIRRVADLKGRSIGVGALGSLLHVLMVALLRKHGVDPASTTFVDIGSSADVIRAVSAGKVDAGPSQLEVYYHQQRFGVHVLEDGKFWEELPQATFQGAFTTEKAIAGKRDALVRTLAAYAELYRFICLQNSLEAFRSAATEATGAKGGAEAGEEWSFFQKYKSLAIDLTLEPERLHFLQELNVALGVQKKELPFDEVADMSLARDAVELLSKRQ